MEEYIRANIVPKICEYYGREIQNVTNCDIRALDASFDSWSSTSFQLSLTIGSRDEKNTDEHYNMFVKCALDNFTIRTQAQNMKQFSNEIHIYKTVKPIFCELLGSNRKLFPQIAYAEMKQGISKENPDAMSAIIVMEDLKEHGYKLGPRGGFDLEHCILALEQLGRWHAVTLVLKETKPKMFRDTILAPLQDCQESEERKHRIQNLLGMAVDRVYRNIDQIKDPKARETLELYKEKSVDMYSYLRGIMKKSTESKLSLLCHGEFCRNNILFKYDENEKPIEAIPIDYQHSSHGTPASDLAPFFYVSTNIEVRKNHFMTLMEKYYDSLKSTMLEILSRDTANREDKSHLIVPSFESILDDYRQHGIVGLSSGIFYFPYMICSPEELQRTTELLRENNSPELPKVKIDNIGGDSVTKEITQMFETAIMLDGIVIE